MSLTLVSSSAVPIDLEEVKRHLNIEHNEDDEKIISLMPAAIGIAEHYAQIKILESVWQYKMPTFKQSVALPVSPVISIDSISYIDTSGNTQPINGYYLKKTPFQPTLLAAYGETWPTTQDGYESVTITLTAGYSEFPADMKEALFKIMGSLLENREDDAPVVLSEVPISSKTILDRYAARTFGGAI